MNSKEDQEAKLEYLKLLLEQKKQSVESFYSVVKGFFTFSIVFFVFSEFHPSELSLFGAKVDIPENVISSIAPIVLSFYFLRIASLYETQQGYEDDVKEIIPQAIHGNKWELNNTQIAKLSQSIFWFKDLDTINGKEVGRLYLLVYMLIYFIMILTLFFLPTVVIGYFVWVLWTSQNALSREISIITCLIVLPSLVILFNQFREEASTVRRKMK